MFKTANVVQQYNLVPSDSHKSFYGKARVVIFDNGCAALISYSTVVLFRDNKGKLHRTWDGWSATTGRHIRAWVGLNKAEYCALPYEA